MKVYCWETPFSDYNSFYVMADSKEIAIKLIKKYINNKMNGKTGGGGWKLSDFDFSIKEKNEVFHNYEGWE